MEDKRVREIAILRYEKGEKPKKIYTDLGKSKSWFFKWHKRYKLEKSRWSESKSKRPRSSPNRTAKDTQDLLIDTRLALVNIRKIHPSCGVRICYGHH